MLWECLKFSWNTVLQDIFAVFLFLLPQAIAARSVSYMFGDGR
jgi:hypothetical protein